MQVRGARKGPSRHSGAAHAGPVPGIGGGYRVPVSAVVSLPAVLRVPAFRNVWIGSVLSNGGTWFQAVAAGWLILQITGSATMVGLLALAYRAPAFLLSTWGGKLADRYDWRRIGITTFSVEAAGALALARYRQTVD